MLLSLWFWLWVWVLLIDRRFGLCGLILTRCLIEEIVQFKKHFFFLYLNCECLWPLDCTTISRLIVIELHQLLSSTEFDTISLSKCAKWFNEIEILRRVWRKYFSQELRVSTEWRRHRKHDNSFNFLPLTNCAANRCFCLANSSDSDRALMIWRSFCLFW